MSEKSSGGSSRQRRKSQEVLGRALGLTRIAQDLAREGVVWIRGNSKLEANGPTGVIIFLPGGSVGSDGLIVLPDYLRPKED